MWSSWTDQLCHDLMHEVRAAAVEDGPQQNIYEQVSSYKVLGIIPYKTQDTSSTCNLAVPLSTTGKYSSREPTMPITHASIPTDSIRT
jgi:hypothetical protein